MVFIISQKYQEYPGKWTQDVINIGVIDGFKLLHSDENPDDICVFTTYNGMEKFIFKTNQEEDATRIIEQIMRTHVNNEAHIVNNIDEFLVSDIKEVMDKEVLEEIIYGILEKYGYGDIADQYMALLDREEDSLCKNTGNTNDEVVNNGKE